MKRGDLPLAFRAPPFLKSRSVAITAMTLAAAADAVFGHFSDALSSATHQCDGALCALTTLVFGVAFALVIRRFERTAAFYFSVVLAAINAGAALALLKLAHDAQVGRHTTPADVLFGLGMGIAGGAIVWLPALVGCWLVAGFPLYIVKQAAKGGLEKEERAERWVAAVGMVVTGSIVLLDLTLNLSHLEELTCDGRAALAFAGSVFALGIATLVSTTARGRARRRFLAAVRAGDHPDFCIRRKRGAGEALFRVQMSDANYRVASVTEEELIDIDAQGDAARAIGAV